MADISNRNDYIIKNIYVQKRKVCKKRKLSWVWGVDRKNPSLAITVWHHEASLVMPDSDPRDGFFYLPLTPMIDPYSGTDTHNLLIPIIAAPYNNHLLDYSNVWICYIFNRCSRDFVPHNKWTATSEPTFGHVRPVKIQTSLHICRLIGIFTGRIEFAQSDQNIHWIAKDAKLFSCRDWFMSSLGTHVRRDVRSSLIVSQNLLLLRS